MSAPTIAAGLAAHQFGGVGIALLRHDRRAGRERVGELDETELRRRPQHDLFGEAREMRRRDRRGGERLEREVAVGDAVERIGGRPVEVKRLRGHVAVDRKRGAGERSRAERTFVEALARVLEPSRVAPQHLDIGHEMMAEGDRLRRLQMGEARHDNCRAVERAGRQRPLQLSDLGEDRVDRVAHPEAEIDRHLVVARACGVQPPGRRADDLGEPAFDVHMDIFQRARERERPRLDFAFDLGETLGDRLGVVGFDDASGSEHGEMGLGAGDVLGAKLAVEVDRGVDLLHRLGWTPGEPAAPHRVAHARRLG